jgi:hypothetical protein
MAHFEKALSHHSDHPSAVVGLSDILLDIYCQKLPPEPATPITSATYASYISSTPWLNASASQSNPLKKQNSLDSTPSTHSPNLSRQNTANSIARQDSINDKNASDKLAATTATPHSEDHTPEELNRLAARDRAYGLLSTLTKLGAGWDYSEAWFSLARAYEESGQIGKAKEVLWWCVELEDTRPVRGWGSVIGV